MPVGYIENTLLAIPDLEDNSTGENINALILNVFKKAWSLFLELIAFSADNAAAMQRKKNRGIFFFRKRKLKYYCYRLLLPSNSSCF